MESASDMVIKVKYGETLRRFNASFVGDELDLTMYGLRKKIISLFRFPPETELILTYIDEDDDVVALVDADDLLDAVKQDLDPLRITVKLHSEKSEGRCSHLVVKTEPEPLGEKLLKQVLADSASPKPDSNDPEFLKQFAELSMALHVASLNDKTTKVVRNETSSSKELGIEAGNRDTPKKPDESSNSPPVADNVPTEKEVSKPSEPRAGGPANERPFSGIAVGNTSYASSTPAIRAVPFGRSSSQNDGTADKSLHFGISCDGCGIYPISGPRFNSKVKVDYDLCSTCFSEMGNSTDYVRMDRPAIYANHMSFKDPSDPYQSSISPQVCSRGSKIKSFSCKLDSRFIQDMNVMDGTAMAPLTPFTKIWRMRNNGMVAWPQFTQLVWIGGDKLSKKISVELEIPAPGLPVSQELDIAVDFKSPQLPGRYISYWRMVSPSGQKFGQRIWVLIQVDASMKVTPCESISCLNLNLPPVVSEVPNVAPLEPTMEDTHVDPTNLKQIELVEPVADPQPNNSQEVKFPPSPIPPPFLTPPFPSFYAPISTGSGGASSSFQPPIVAPIPTGNGIYPYPPPFFGPYATGYAPSYPFPIGMPPMSNSREIAAKDLPGENEVEEKLLKELEEMGFKQVDLNKEVLRMCGYNLEQSVNHLCGIDEWDPILEELQEMGFHDTEMNKKLLKKNKGSIKRSVLDLVAGEKKDV